MADERVGESGSVLLEIRAEATSAPKAFSSREDKPADRAKTAEKVRALGLSPLERSF